MNFGAQMEKLKSKPSKITPKSSIDFIFKFSKKKKKLKKFFFRNKIQLNFKNFVLGFTARTICWLLGQILLGCLLQVVVSFVIFPATAGKQATDAWQNSLPRDALLEQRQNGDGPLGDVYGFSTPEAALMLISFIWFLVTALPAIQLNLMETRLQFFYSFPMLLSMFVSIFICFGLLCLIWSTPNATTCMFGINCDYTTMLDAPGRFIAVPQLLRIQQMIGSHFVFPTEENGYAYTFNLQWMQAVEEKLEKYFGYLARCEAKFRTTTLFFFRKLKQKSSKMHEKCRQNLKIDL